MKRFKRYCKSLQLKNEMSAIEEYKKLHAMGAAWPEISEGMKSVGIIDMEIYLTGRTLFMIMDTAEDFDHDLAMSKLSELPRQSEWETVVSRYQMTSADSTAKDKWRLIERIYKLDQDAEYDVSDGYPEEI
jgi:L-rhamnose mutarotase